MGMINHGPGPGVDYHQNPWSSADVMGIACQFHESPGSRLAQNAKQLSLVGSDDGPQFLWQREDQVEVGDRKQKLLTLLGPSARVLAVALRTVAIAAGVIGVVDLSALVALEDMASKGLGAAICYVAQRPDMTRQHAITELPEVVGAVEPEDLGKLRHQVLLCRFKACSSSN